MSHAEPPPASERPPDAQEQVAGPAGAPAAPFTGHGEVASARAQYARRLAGHQQGVPALNRLANLAARLLDAESAQISIIADEQSVMGGAGAAFASVGRSSPAAESLCSVTVGANEPVLVADAPHDTRVQHLPPVASGTVGSYLGVPLVAAGHTVGALCVFDASTRSWTDEDVTLLEELTSPVLAELELASLEASYQGERLLWQLAIDAAGVGVFDWDLATGELRWDERLLELFGLTRETFGETIEAFNATVHPDDRDRVSQVLSHAIEARVDFATEYRVVLPSGTLRWITAKGQVLTGPDGQASRVLGAAFDSTAVQEGEARVARILESMPTAFFHLDADWRFTYANTEAERLLGGIGTPVIGRNIWELFPDAVGSDFETHYRQAVATGEPVEFDAYYPPPLDNWYEVRAWPTPDGLSVYFLDVTDNRRAQEDLARAARRSALLTEVTESLSGTLDPHQAVARLARIVVPLLGDWCVITAVEGNEPSTGPEWQHRLRDIGSWHAEPDARARVARYAELRISAVTDTALLEETLSAGSPLLVQRGAADAIAAALEPGEARDLIAELAPESAAAVPLRGRGRVAGMLTIFRGRGREPFSEADLGTLADIGGRAGLPLDIARDYAQQRDLAEGLQRSLLTAPPEPDHLEIVVRYEPAADAAQVGGDWYDAFMQRDGAVNLVIGDVVGHDTAAAAAMGQVRTLLRGIAVATGQHPAALLREVDQTMRTLQVETIATAVVGRFEQTSAERDAGLTRLRWSNAGHPPPMAAIPRPAAREVGADVDVAVLWAERSNLLLGLDPTVERTESVVTLPRGTTLLLYTDGLVERRGQPLDEGLEALRTVFGDLVERGMPLEQMCDELLHRMLPERPDDDVALVVVRLHPEDRPRPAEAGPEDVPPGFPTH